jgi:predicted alpha/beta-hydrolase family hydrolase
MQKCEPRLKSQSEIRIALEGGGTTTALVYRAATPSIGATLILGHGAGAGQRSSFMVEFACALSRLGLDVMTFNFLYTEHGRRIPDRAPALDACYHDVVRAARAHVSTAASHLFIGGKSMGGRIATHIAAADPDLPIDGLVLLGYPLHPPGRADKPRDKHLPSIHKPILVVQGSRDTFGLPAELMPVLQRITPRPALEVVNDGDHSFKLPRKNPAAQATVYANIQSAIANWIASAIKR